VILRLAIIGFGNVGQEFARMLVRKRDWLVKAKGLDVEVLAIATKSRGSLLSERGLDLSRVDETINRDGHLGGYGREYTDLNPLELIDNCDADVVVELTTLNIDSGQPAIDHISNALQSKMHVITANKGPIAFAYDQLESIARSRNVKLRFEGTVMDGTPIFNLAEKTLQGCEIVSLQGILNSTSNYVLTEMTQGRTLDDAVREAQRRGIVEADPSLDLEGWDAAAKIAALANVLMGAGITPRDVEREGMSGITMSDIASAKDAGEKIRVIARADRAESEVVASVAVSRVRTESPFWSVDGTSSALTISTDLMGDITILETNPALTQTAYAVFSDLLSIAEWIRCNSV
jgi:homoserine dehydrogenase